MLTPKKVKYRKQFRGKLTGVAQKGQRFLLGRLDLFPKVLGGSQQDK